MKRRRNFYKELGKGIYPYFFFTKYTNWLTCHLCSHLNGELLMSNYCNGWENIVLRVWLPFNFFFQNWKSSVKCFKGAGHDFVKIYIFFLRFKCLQCFRKTFLIVDQNLSVLCLHNKGLWALYLAYNSTTDT